MSRYNSLAPNFRSKCSGHLPDWIAKPDARYYLIPYRRSTDTKGDSRYDLPKPKGEVETTPRKFGELKKIGKKISPFI